MKLYAPAYYPRFRCIADRCRHSCCIGWEIDVDRDTLQKYAALTDGYGPQIARSINHTDTPHFRLCEGERCPHLNEQGLCRIILSLGEDYLCDICREHPRFYHDTPHGKEVGLGMACEEACRIILSSDDYATMIPVEEPEDEVDEDIYDATAARAHLYALLVDRTRPYAARIDAIEKQFDVSPAEQEDDTWRTLLSELEYLDESHRPLFFVYTSAPARPREWEAQLERALAYFIFRHCSAAYDPEDLRAAVGLCLMLERLLASMIAATKPTTDEQLVRLSRILSEELEYSEDNTEQIKSVFLF